MELLHPKKETELWEDLAGWKDGCNLLYDVHLFGVYAAAEETLPGLARDVRRWAHWKEEFLLENQPGVEFLGAVAFVQQADGLAPHVCSSSVDCLQEEDLLGRVEDGREVAETEEEKVCHRGCPRLSAGRRVLIAR